MLGNYVMYSNLRFFPKLSQILAFVQLISTNMELDKTFKYQLFLLKLYGYQFTYEPNWQGILVKSWGYCLWACPAIGAVTGCHSIFTNLDNIAVFTESTSYTLNWTMCFIRFTAFFIHKKRLMKLVDDLLQMTKTGKIPTSVRRSI